MHPKKKIAVVLLNIGGPRDLKQVRPYLFRFFMDPHIIPFVLPFRFLLALLISFFRGAKTKNIYRHIGGFSPLYENTKKQTEALENLLKEEKEFDFKCFFSMRYTEPFSKRVLREIKNWEADDILLLPLYPQYSTTTTQSSFDDWKDCCHKYFFKGSLLTINHYYNDPFYIDAMVDQLQKSLNQCNHKDSIRILFSAHGLPKKVIEKGDPYQTQIEETSRLIYTFLNKEKYNNIDYVVCYQSRVGLNKWLEPDLYTTLKKASDDHCSVIIVPISFVSDHSETLYELDIDYKKRAKDLGIQSYIRVDTLGISDAYINCLKSLVLQKVKEEM